jgi:hypothetical protein
MGGQMAATSTHILWVALRYKASVYRDIEIDSNKSLYALAEAIVHAFDFNFDHCFGFYSGLTERTMFDAQPQYELFADIGEESNAQSVKRTRVAEAFPKVGHTLMFLFDYGDEWLFRVKVLGFGEKIPRTRYPKVLTEAGAAPPQYVYSGRG